MEEYMQFNIKKFPVSLNKKLKSAFQLKKENGEYNHYREFLIDLLEESISNNIEEIYLQSVRYKKMDQTIKDNTKGFNDLADGSNENKEILLSILSEIKTLNKILEG
ncbi:hypothetical protein [Enterococcus raffinosus]|uniref:hypothetical protein n=1 Tax=Enterococcus raffinosus TaxID=71452 RepID=UPI00288F04BF|nr:hypothetical protein [Enterococcus raffinosus]MDT2525144.1 hypothetical protein [Enterococcus raffinosus]